MKIIGKIISAIVWILLGLIIIYNIYSFISIKVLGKELSTVHGYGQLKVVSGSMEPTINIGDLIIIDTKVTEYKENDIITFKDIKGSFVTHRIIEITSEGYITKGDNNESIDQGFITEKDIVGKYVFRIKYLGVLLDSFQNPITMILILIMGIILCFLISTDKDGMPKDITEEEKEFITFLETKRKLEKTQELKDIPKTPKKTPSKKETKKVSSTSKKEDEPTITQTKKKSTATPKKAEQKSTTSKKTTGTKNQKKITKKATQKKK